MARTRDLAIFVTTKDDRQLYPLAHARGVINSTSLRSTRENRHFGASFTSVGGVEAEISMPPKWTFSNLFWCSGASIYRVLHPPTDMKLAPKCLFSWVLRNDIEFYLRGVQKKNLKIKIYPPCFEKVFFRKISLRGLQWHIFSLVYPLWCWRNKRLKIFWQGHHLKVGFLFCLLHGI